METGEVRSSHTLASVYDFSERVISRYIPGIFLVIICTLITAEILARTIFNHSFIGVIDLVEQAVVMLTYLALAGVQKERGHINMDILPKKLRSRRAGYILDCIFLTICIATMVIIFFIVCMYWIQTIKEHDQLSTLVWPKWPFMVTMPMGILFIAIRLCIQFWESFSLAFGKKAFEEMK